MASNNFQTNISFKGSFDASEILASIKQMREQLSQTSNVELLGNLDKQIKKVESLGSTISAQIGKGFSSQKEFTSFQNNINKLELEFKKLGNSFENINADNLNKSLSAVRTQIKDLQKEAKTLTREFSNSFSTVASGATGKFAEGLKREIVDSAKSGKDLAEVYNTISVRTAEALEAEKKRTQEIKTQLAEKQKERNQAQEKSLKVGFQTSNFKILNKDGSIGGKISQDQLSKVREEFAKIITSAKNAKEATTLFQQSLQNMNIVAANTETITNKVQRGFTDYKESTKEIDKSINQLTNDLQKQTQSEENIAIQSDKVRQALQGKEQEYKNASSAVKIHSEESAKLTEVENRLKEESRNTGNQISNLSSSMNGAVDSLRDGTAATKDSVDAQQKMNSTLDQLKNKLKYLLSFGNAYRQLRKIITQTFRDVQNLDRAFASIAMVTDKTVAGLWETYDQYAEIANKLGQTAESAIKSSALFYQQGLDTAEALRLTEDTMKLATLAGANFETATQQMTAALRGFHMEMDQGAHVTDVYSELAANAAADVNGIAYAMSKTASIANSAGMSFETTAAFLTNMIETTQEAPENIGTAMKTIIARFTELKENVSAADSEFDDLDYNKVDKALKSVGIQLKDTQGQFRNLDDVFLELSSKWSTLDRNTQRYIATIAAGSRQQSRFIAMMEDYERTMELVETAQDSAGRSEEQFAKYQDTVEFKINRLKNSWEQLRTTMLDSNVFKNVIDQLTDFVQSVSKIDFKKLLVLSPIIVPMIKQFIKLFADGIKNNYTAFNKIGSMISQSITSKFDKAGRDIVNRLIDLDFLKRQVDLAKQEISRLENVDVSIKNDKARVQAQLNAAQQKHNQLSQRFANMDNPYDFEERERLNESLTRLDNKINNLKQDLEILNIAQNQNEQEMRKSSQAAEELSQEYNNKNKTLQDSQEKLKQISFQISNSLQMVATSAVTAFAAIASGADATDSLKIMTNALLMQLASLSAQFIATATSTAITAKNSGKTIGVAFGEGLSEGVASTGVGILIVGIGVLITLLAQGIIALVKQYKNEHKSLDQQIEEAEKKLKQLEQVEKDKKEAASEARETKEETEKLMSRYDELNRKIVKTTEEQEEWNELITDINNQFPEIVTSYDEANGKITIQRDLWQEIVDLQKESAQEAQLEASIATAASIGQKRKNEYLNYQKKIKEISNIYDFQSGDKNKVAQAFGYRNYDNLSEEEKYDFITRFLNKNDVGWNKINQEIINISNLAKDAYERQMEYYDKLEKESISSYLQSGGTKKGVADFIATGAQRYKTKNVGQFDLKTVANAEDIYSNKTVGREILETLTLGVSEAFYTNIKASQTNDFQKWEELSADQKKILKSLGYEDKKAWDEARKNLADDTDFLEQYAEAAYTYNAEKLAKALDQSFSEDQKDFIDNYMTNYASMTEEEMTKAEEIIQKYIDSITDEDTRLTAQISFKDWINEFDKQKEELSTEIAKFLNEDAGNFTNWTIEQLQAYDKLIQNAIDSMGTGAGIKYSEDIYDLFKELNPSQINQALNLINFDSANALNWEDFREESIKKLKEIGIPAAEAFFDNWADQEKRWGHLSISIVNEEELQEYLEKIDETIKNISGSRDDIVELNAKITKGEKLNLDDYDKYAKAIEDLGLIVSDYIRIDPNGEIVANAEGLKTIYQEAYDQQINSLNQQIQAIDEERKLRRDNLKIIKEENQSQIEALDLEQKRLKVSLQRSKINASDAINRETNEDRKSKMQSYVNEIERQLKELEDTRINVEEEIAAEEQKYQEQLKILNNQELEAKKQLQEKLKEIEARKAADAQLYAEEYAKALEEEVEEVKDNLEDLTKAAEEAAEKVVQAQEKVKEALEKIAEKEQDVIDKTNELNKTLYGDSLHSNKLDPMYNYNTALDRLTKKAKDAKESLENMQSGDNAEELIKTYAENMKGIIANRSAQNRVLQSSIANYQNILSSRLSQEISSLNAKHGSNMSTDVSNYVYQNGDRLGINFQALNAAALPDEISDYVEEVVQTINDLQDQIDDNVDAIKDAEKELRDMRKNALQRRANMQKDMAEVLKKQNQDEIDSTKEKYEALKEADDEYLSALEDAINKQRELRQRQNEWDELATKEKKLSLMQRDTSGANQKEILQLENEVQDAREKLLDNSIDDMLKGMKELYELQEETREMELEYQEALLDSVNYIKLAEELLDSFETAEDYVAWMCENNVETIENTSQAEKELLIMNWQETGEQMTADTQILTTNLNELAIASEQEIGLVIANTSEMMTSQAELTLAQIKESVDQAITDGENALKDAIKEVQNARDDYREALKELQEAEAAAREAEEAARAAEAQALAQAGGSQNSSSSSWSTNNFNDSTRTHSYDASYWNNIYNAKNNDNYHAKDNIARMAYADGYISVTDSNGNTEFVSRYASGGLVDYTGPAWVDGTPSKPEAFLSAEDTQRIGAAAQLLSQIPIFGGSIDNTSVNNGDSLIEVHINIENISSEVDLDNALDKMKNAIWEAARPAGSSVILSK